MSWPFQLVKPAYAQCNPGSRDGVNLVECLRLNDSQTVGQVYGTPTSLVNTIVPNLFIIAGIIIFLMIVLAGFQIITNGKKGLEEGRSILQAALIGFILMFCAYWIVRIIEVISGMELIF